MNIADFETLALTQPFPLQTVVGIDYAEIVLV